MRAVACRTHCNSTNDDSARCSGPRRLGMMVAACNPFRMEMAVLAHQTNLGAFAVGAKLLRRINGEHHGFVLSLVGAVLVVAVFDVPLVLDLIVDDEIAGGRHANPRFPISS